jgi:hypothetical protein
MQKCCRKKITQSWHYGAHNKLVREHQALERARSTSMCPKERGALAGQAAQLRRHPCTERRGRQGDDAQQSITGQVRPLRWRAQRRALGAPAARNPAAPSDTCILACVDYLLASGVAEEQQSLGGRLERWREVGLGGPRDSRRQQGGKAAARRREENWSSAVEYHETKMHHIKLY